MKVDHSVCHSNKFCEYQVLLNAFVNWSTLHYFAKLAKRWQFCNSSTLMTGKTRTNSHQLSSSFDEAFSKIGAQYSEYQ